MKRSPGSFVGEVRNHPVRMVLRARGFGPNDSISVDEMWGGNFDIRTAPHRWTGTEWERVDAALADEKSDQAASTA